MKLLIDSHVLIWMLYEPEKIGMGTRDLLGTADAVYVSSVSLWELTLKYTKNKLAYSPKELTEGVIALRLEELPIRHEHLRMLPAITLPHSDPFDGLLMAQNAAEDCTFLTADGLILQSQYRVVRVEPDAAS